MELRETPMTSNQAVTVAIQEKQSAVEGNFEEAKEQFDQEVERIEQKESADLLLESAKEEGFEEALTRLADGDFDQEIPIEVKELVESEKNQEEVEKSEEIQNETAEKDGEEIVMEPDRAEMIAKIKELDGKVVDLEEKNKELFEKVKRVEDNNTIAFETMLEMTMLLHKMLKEEEDNDKKVSMLELLITMMSDLMRAMFVPEDEKSQHRLVQVEQSEPKNKKVIDPEEFARRLLEKRMQKQEKAENPSEHVTQAA